MVKKNICSLTILLVLTASFPPPPMHFPCKIELLPIDSGFETDRRDLCKVGFECVLISAVSYAKHFCRYCLLGWMFSLCFLGSFFFLTVSFPHPPIHFPCKIELLNPLAIYVDVFSSETGKQQ